MAENSGSGKIKVNPVKIALVLVAYGFTSHAVLTLTDPALNAAYKTVGELAQKGFIDADGRPTKKGKANAAWSLFRKNMGPFYKTASKGWPKDVFVPPKGTYKWMPGMALGAAGMMRTKKKNKIPPRHPK